MLAIFLGASWLMVHLSHTVRKAGRWLFEAKRFQAEVLAQPGSKKGDLKHEEWDGWGSAGLETVEYVVFDPHDLLAEAARGVLQESLAMSTVSHGCISANPD